MIMLFFVKVPNNTFEMEKTEKMGSFGSLLFVMLCTFIFNNGFLQYSHNGLYLLQYFH